jgi:putative polyhydroxyalkanoate system protein
MMSTIDVRHAHALPKDEAKRLAEELVRSMKHGADFDLRWEGDRIIFTAARGITKGTHGTIDVSEKDVRVQIDLPLHLRIVKTMMEAKVNDKLARLSASPAH